MRPDDLRELLRRRPFEPFRLQLSNGVVYEIRHPELVVPGRSIAWIHLPETIHSVALAARQVGIVMIHIVQIEFIPPTATPSAN